MRKVISVLVMLVVLSSPVLGVRCTNPKRLVAQDTRSADDRALDKAQELWGEFAKVSKVKKAIDRNWTYSVGCYYGEKQPFIVAGEGTSWTQAFASVDMLKNGIRDFGNRKAYACTSKYPTK